MSYIETTSGAQLSNAQAITTTADSTNIFDVTGAGVGNTPKMIGAGGVSTALGVDIGGSVPGSASPYIWVTIPAVTTVSGTLTITIKAAPDNGSGSEGTYTTLASTAALTGSTQLFAGAQYALPIPPTIPGEAIPRFYKLTYTVSASISLTATAYVGYAPPMTSQGQKYGSNFVSV